MKRQTKTQLGFLRIGDRFYFLTDKIPVVREVTNHLRNRVKYNKIKSTTGRKSWWFDRSRAIETPVMFIRHTQLLPGDECFMHELTDGDVFTKPGDKRNKEMRRGPNRKDGQVWVRYMGSPVWLHTSPLTTGIFVRRASLKTTPKKDVQ